MVSGSRSSSRNSSDISKFLIATPPQVPLWNVPQAIPRRRLTATDWDFEQKKKLLAHRLPVLTVDEIARERCPFHVTLIRDLEEAGYEDVTREIKVLMRKQEFYQTDQHLLNKSIPKLEYNRELLTVISEGLKLASEVKNQYLAVITRREQLAEEMVRMDQVWIAKHFYQSCLDLSLSLESKENADQVRSEMKCMLGYLEMENIPQSDWAVKVATLVLEEARELSKDKEWIFHSKILVMKLKKPICLYGLREDFTIINGHSMTVHAVASLLLNEILQAKAASIVFSPGKQHVSEFYLAKAQKYSEMALRLAEEVNQVTASISALMTLGAVFLMREDYQPAVEHLLEFQKHAEAKSDHEAEAIAFNMLGNAYIGLKDSVSALENFIRQKEIAELHNIPDVKADALQNIGKLLLLEGELIEAELCFSKAYHELKGFQKMENPPQNIEGILENVWVTCGMSAGLNAWGRFAGHCRRGHIRDYDEILEWKSHREALGRVGRPFLGVPTVRDSFPIYDSANKMPTLSPEVIQQLVTEMEAKVFWAPEISRSEMTIATSATTTARTTEVGDPEPKVTIPIELMAPRRSSLKKSPLSSGSRTTDTRAGSSGFSTSSAFTDTSTDHHHRRKVPDFNDRIVYESDLRPGVIRVRDSYLHKGSMWQLASARQTLILDLENPNRSHAPSVAVIPLSEDPAYAHPLKLSEDAAKDLLQHPGASMVLIETSPEEGGAAEGVVSHARKVSDIERDATRSRPYISRSIAAFVGGKSLHKAHGGMSFYSKVAMGTSKLIVPGTRSTMPRASLWDKGKEILMNKTSVVSRKGLSIVNLE